MRTIAHLSDLHFGRSDSRVVTALQAHLEELRPDLLVVSGDLTQRAKVEEFQQARAFLDSIHAPQVVIPGNHDIELYNLYGRFVERLDRFRRYVSENVEPTFLDSEIAVVSVNTARSLTFKGGRINSKQVRRLREILCTVSVSAVKILAAHHPLDLPESMEHPLTGRARQAMAALSGCGIDIILSGHLHISRFSEPAEKLRIGGHSSLLVQAGTAVSTRSRGETNSFNVIETSDSAIGVHQHSWDEGTGGFTRVHTQNYTRNQNSA